MHLLKTGCRHMNRTQATILQLSESLLKNEDFVKYINEIGGELVEFCPDLKKKNILFLDIFDTRIFHFIKETEIIKLTRIVYLVINEKESANFQYISGLNLTINCTDGLKAIPVTADEISKMDIETINKLDLEIKQENEDIKV